MMYNIVIIEDNIKTLRLLYHLIENSNITNIRVVGSGSHLSDVLPMIRKKEAEIIISDIELIGGTIFEALDKVNSLKAKIIFVTGHEEYAFEALKYKPIKYLLKPLQPQKLYEALKETMQQIEKEQQSSKVNNLKKGKIVFKGFKGLHILDINDIVRFEADRNYSKIILASGSEIMLSSNLAQLDSSYGTPPLVRIHKSHIINLNNVIHFSTKGSKPTLEMINGDIIPVSRNKKSMVIQFLMKENS